MLDSHFSWAFRDGAGSCTRGNHLHEALGGLKKAHRVLAVNPHDDDLVISGGLLIPALLADGAHVSVAVVTDGRQGYCKLDQRDTIVRTRKDETIEAYKLLGVRETDIHFLGFPCSNMLGYQGRRKARPEEKGMPTTIEGAVGIQNSLTWLMRKTRPTIILMPHGDDYHPDHKTTHSETLISIFHAQGQIWPELGEKIDDVPELWETVVYCNYVGAGPNLLIDGGPSYFERKMRAITCFRSQPQIEALVHNLRLGSQNEVVRRQEFKFYQPGQYDVLFAVSN